MPRKEGYGPNPADNPVNEFGEPIRSSQNFMKQPGSTKAKKYSNELRKRTSDKRSARQVAIREAIAKSKLIPASPTK